MALQYINGQVYDVPLTGSVADYVYTPSNLNRMIANGQLKPITIGSQAPAAPAPQVNASAQPFTTASSGGVHGTMQPYINRMTQNASNALYGGLLNYQPQSMIAGNAGGTPQNSSVPNFNVPGLLQNFQGFGNRSWMGT